MKKRIKNLMKSLVVCAVAIALTALPTKVTKAEEYENIQLTHLKNADDVVNTKPVLEIEWYPDEKSLDSYWASFYRYTKSVKDVAYGRFTLKEDSVVVIMPNATYYDERYLGIKAQVDDVWVESARYYDTKNEVKLGEPVAFVLSKGTHTVKVSPHRANFATESGYTAKGNINIGYIPLKEAIKVTESKQKGKIVVSVKSNLGSYTPSRLRYTDSKEKFKNRGNREFWRGKKTKEVKFNSDNVATFKVKNTGWYTINFGTAGDTFWSDAPECRFQVNYKVTGKDTEKPVVTGVSNNETYTTPVKVKFSDKGSGVKSAKLNGKAIKSGKTIKKSGNYKLVVIDKSGNKTTVKFKIKK